MFFNLWDECKAVVGRMETVNGIGAEANGQVTTIEHWDGTKE